LIQRIFRRVADEVGGYKVALAEPQRNDARIAQAQHGHSADAVGLEVDDGGAKRGGAIWRHVRDCSRIRLPARSNRRAWRTRLKRKAAPEGAAYALCQENQARLRRRTAIPARPAPRSASEAGSGAGVAVPSTNKREMPREPQAPVPVS